MKTETYKCDGKDCGHSQDSPTEPLKMFSIKIEMRGPGIYGPIAVTEGHYCEDCAKANGLLSSAVGEGKQVDPPTLDDLVHDMVQEEIAAQLDQ